MSCQLMAVFGKPGKQEFKFLEDFESDSFANLAVENIRLEPENNQIWQKVVVQSTKLVGPTWKLVGHSPHQLYRKLRPWSICNFWSVTLQGIRIIWGHPYHQRFSAHNWRLERDIYLGMVSLSLSRRDSSIHMQLNLLRSPRDLDLRGHIIQGVPKKVSPLTEIVNISVTLHPTALGGLSLERADNVRPDRPPYVDLHLSQNAFTIFDDKYDYQIHDETTLQYFELWMFLCTFR